jgi:hypothetical protein
MTFSSATGDFTSRTPGIRLVKKASQIEGHRPQCVRQAPARHELQIPVHQPLTQPVTDLTRPRHQTHKTRKVTHISTIPVRDTRTQERHGSPVY